MERPVAHEPMRERDEEPLQDRLSPGDGSRGVHCFLVVKQPASGADRGTHRFAAHSRWSDTDVGVVAHSLGLPGLVVRADERPVTFDGDRDRGVNRGTVAPVAGQQGSLAPGE
jgi:hypothetical protein